MNFLSLIESKRDGKHLTSAQIKFFINAFVAEKIPDYQMSALLMAIYFRGLNVSETRDLTLAMRDSGDVLEFPKDSRPLVDKHSTGGVGDKVSLPLAPLLACLGFRVPMISGRGLGITGGTLDKLESIPGFQTLLPAEKIIEQVQSVGCVICGQTDKMVPADKKIYALRDVTGTVSSIPLITASILSKKLAEGLDALILDVKFGAAAFMPTIEKGRELAQAMVTLGNECGVNTRAILTNMDSPLGRAAGNWLEVKESIDCLHSESHEGLSALVIECAAHLLVQTNRAANFEEAVARTVECLESGAPRKKFDEMLVAQGTDLDAFNRKLAGGDTARVVKDLKAEETKIVQSCDARIVGEIVRDLGGGRKTKECRINHDAGIDQLAKAGETIAAGSTLARVHAVNEADADVALKRLHSAFTFGAQPPPIPPAVHEVIS